MPRDGSGNYVLPSGNPVVPNTVISSSGWGNPTMEDIAAALTASMSRDGQSPPTANIPMGNFRFTGLAVGVDSSDSVRMDQIGSFPPLFRSGGNTSVTSSTITVQPGSWRSFDNTFNLVLATSFGKILQGAGAWSPGAGGSGNFNTGAPVTGIYNIFVIRKISDGTLDIGFDTNVSATHIPSGYAAYRRIGSFFVTASLTIQPYIQAGNWFSYAPGVPNYTNIGLSGGSTQGIVTVPSGVQTIAKLRTVLQGNSGINVAFQPRPLSATPGAQDTDLIGVTSSSIADTVEVVADTAASIVLFSTGTFASGLFVTTAAFQDFLGD